MRDNTTAAAMFAKENVLGEALLRQWMAQQRKPFMKSLGVLDCNDKSNWGTPYLTRNQKELLDAVNFQWGHLKPSSLSNDSHDVVYSVEFQKRVRLSYKDWQWNQWYRRLCVFASQHGHTRVSASSMMMSTWQDGLLSSDHSDRKACQTVDDNGKTTFCLTGTGTIVPTTT